MSHSGIILDTVRAACYSASMKTEFTQVHDWPTIRKMSNCAKNVFITLVDIMDKQNGVQMGIQSLTGSVGMSIAQVKRGIKELKLMGAIETFPAGRMTIYLLNPEIVWEDKPWRRSEAKIPIMWIRSKEIEQ